jgi:hypothetical protein
MDLTCVAGDNKTVVASLRLTAGQRRAQDILMPPNFPFSLTGGLDVSQQAQCAPVFLHGLRFRV